MDGGLPRSIYAESTGSPLTELYVLIDDQVAPARLGRGLRPELSDGELLSDFRSTRPGTTTSRRTSSGTAPTNCAIGPGSVEVSDARRSLHRFSFAAGTMNRRSGTARSAADNPRDLVASFWAIFALPRLLTNLLGCTAVGGTSGSLGSGYEITPPILSIEPHIASMTEGG